MKKFLSRRQFIIFLALFFQKIKAFSFERRSIKTKILKFPGVFGLNIIENELYAPSLTRNSLIKYNEKNFKISYLNDFNVGWERTFKKKDILKSIHYADIYNQKLLLTFYHTNKVILYNIYSKKIIDLTRVNPDKKINGPSVSIFIKDKKLICVSEYHGNVSFYDLSGKFVFDIKKKLNLLKIKKPHTTKYFNGRYFIIDTASKKINILNKLFDLEKTINNSNINSQYKNLKQIKLQTPVSINNYKNQFYFVSDVISGIIIFDLNFKILGNINNNNLIFKNLTFEIPEVYKPYDAILEDSNLYIANTHKDNVLKLYNFNKILNSDI